MDGVIHSEHNTIRPWKDIQEERNHICVPNDVTMNWVKIEERTPEEVENIDVVVLVKLRPKTPDQLPRKHGDICTAVFYKGKFHLGFTKGYILDVIEWMPLPSMENKCEHPHYSTKTFWEDRRA